MRGALLLLLGCNRALGLDPTTELDAYKPPGCAGARFTTTTDLNVMTMDEIHDPTMFDASEIWFTLRSAAGPSNIASATRTDPTAEFGPPAIGSFSITDDDTDPAITRDGLHLLFISSDSRLYQADRATRDSAWSPPSLVPGIDGESVGMGFDVTPDGLAVYFPTTKGVLTARRDDPTGTFGPVTMLAEDAMIQFPSVSPDELELFFNPRDQAHANELHRFTRMNTAADFGDEEVIYQDAVDADLTADAQTIIYFHGGQLQTAHRDCP